MVPDTRKPVTPMSQPSPSSSQSLSPDTAASAVDQAVASGGSYEVLAKRLDGQGQALETLARQLNEERLEEFGRSQMEVIGRMRVRTENNCLGRDIAQVDRKSTRLNSSHLVISYAVFCLKKKI